MEKEPTNAEILRTINKRDELDKEHRDSTTKFFERMEKKIDESLSKVAEIKGNVDTINTRLIGYEDYKEKVSRVHESLKDYDTVKQKNDKNTNYRYYLTGALAVITFAGGGIITFYLRSIDQKIENQNTITQLKISQTVKDAINSKVISAEFEK